LAAEVLGGVPDVRGTAALARALEDDDANVRVTAAEALGRAALAGEESRTLAIEALVAALSASDTFLKIAALDSLAPPPGRRQRRRRESPERLVARARPAGGGRGRAAARQRARRRRRRRAG